MNYLNIDEFQELAKTSCPDLGHISDNLRHMRYGIFTEVGEIVDIFKKNLAYKKEIDTVHLGEEIGDCMWYIVNHETFLGSKIFPKFYKPEFDINFMMKCSVENEQVLLAGCLIQLANKFNLNFEELLFKNIEKLRIRFPEGFSEERALNRDLNKERESLEGC